MKWRVEAMNENLLTMEDLFTGRLFIIPDYQRGYAWEEKPQLSDFLDDLELLDEGKQHYTGTVVLKPIPDQAPRYDVGGKMYHQFHVVDGQQRLTTAVLLLDALQRQMASIPQLTGLAEGISRTYVAAEDRNGQPLFKLHLNSDSTEFWKDVILSDGAALVPTISSHKRLAKAKNVFGNYLQKKRDEAGTDFIDWITSLHDKITHQLKVTLYHVQDSAEVGVLFEAMNNRGKPLTELEKVKNYLLYIASKLSLDDHTLSQDVNNAWGRILQRLMAAGLDRNSDEDQLLRAHWLMAYDPRTANWNGSRSVKTEFGLKQYHGRHRELLAKALVYVKTLDAASLAYAEIMNPKHSSAFGALRDIPGRHGELVHASDQLARTNVTAPFLPLLIATRVLFPNDMDKYLETVRLCEKFAFLVFRLLERRSNTGQTSLFGLGHRLFNKETSHDETIEQLRGLLLYYSPSAKFHEALAADRDWYRWYGLKYFLYEYEEHLADGHEVQLPWDVVAQLPLEKTIEHILPQTPEDEYWLSRFDTEARAKLTHDLGNLCLTSDNSSYGRKSFPRKKGAPGESYRCYANSNLFQERALFQLDNWTKESMRRRREELTGWAAEHWNVPDGVVREPEPEDEGD
jgi:hypothetical protein